VTINCPIHLGGSGPISVGTNATLTLTSTLIDMDETSSATSTDPLLGIVGTQQIVFTGPGTVNVPNAVLEPDNTAGTGTGIATTEGMQVTGGTLNAAGILIQRGGNANFRNPLITGTLSQGDTTTQGLGITGGVVNLGTLQIGGDKGNAGAWGTVAGGAVTVTGEVLCGNEAGASSRWSEFYISGGTFTNLDTSIGFVIAPNFGTVVNSALFAIGGGSASIAKLSFGLGSDTVSGQRDLFINNGTLYVGSGGIQTQNTNSYHAQISWFTGLLGALADWSTTNTIVLSGGTGNSFTIQTADGAGNPHNIALNGLVTDVITNTVNYNAGSTPGANLMVTGGGVLTLGATNTYTGVTLLNGGTLALVGDGLSTGLLGGSPLVAVYSPGTLDPTGLTRDGSLHVGDPSVNESISQTLAGNGAVANNVVIGTAGTLLLGSLGHYGTLTVGHNVTNSGAIVVTLDHPPAGATNGGLTAHALIVSPGSTLTIQQGTNDLVTGDTFHVFNIATGRPIYNSANFTSITLPTRATNAGVNYVWDSSHLATTGVLTLITGGVAPVNLNPSNMVFSVSSGRLNISWPANQLGWDLQTNAVNIAVAADWFSLPGSAAVTSTNIAIQTNGSVFLRLHHN